MSWLGMVWPGEWEVQTARATSSFEHCDFFFDLPLCDTSCEGEVSPLVCASWELNNNNYEADDHSCEAVFD